MLTQAVQAVCSPGRVVAPRRPLGALHLMLLLAAVAEPGPRPQIHSRMGPDRLCQGHQRGCGCDERTLPEGGGCFCRDIGQPATRPGPGLQDGLDEPPGGKGVTEDCPEGLKSPFCMGCTACIAADG